MRWRCGSRCCRSCSGSWDCWPRSCWCGACGATRCWAAGMLRVSRSPTSAAGFALQAAFAAPTPGVIALFGRSGSGKTTLVNIISGLLAPDAGEVRLDDEVLTDTRRGIAVPVERRRIGYVFQDARLFPHLRVAGNLRYGAAARARRASRIGFDEVVDACSGSGAAAAAAAPSSPGVNASAWRSAGRCCRSRACCCSMSRWPRSISRGARRCCRTSKRCAIGWRSRWCTSVTSSRRCCASPRTWCCSMAAACWRTAR